MSDTATHEIPQEEDAKKWNTLTTIVFIVGIASALFVAGMSYGNVSTTSDRLDRHIEIESRDYVRKDGRELAEIQGKLNLLNEKIDQLLQRKAIP